MSISIHQVACYEDQALMAPAFCCRFGGELNVQLSFYTLSFLILFSALSGIMNVKQTRKHRKWMLRKSHLS